MSHLFKFTVSHQISEKLLLEATGLIEFKKDQMVKSIFGPSGCGKTSLVKIFLGLIKDSNSRIQFQDQIWQNAKNRILVPTDKRNTGFVPQKECLFPFLNVRDNISYAIKSQGVSVVQTRVHELAQLFQIEDLLDRKISEISGGQKQKVSLARAIAAKPQFLLLDEAFSSLDSKSREELLPKLCLWLNQFEIPTLVVSHDEKDARLLSSEIYQFEDHKLHI